MSGGVKEDKTKPRMDLIPPIVLEALAKVLTYGATQAPRADGSKGYGDHNWAGADNDGTPHPEKGLAWSRTYGALQRHLNDFWAGKAIDESGYATLWHALCELAFLVAQEHYGIGKDDRFTWGEARKQRFVGQVIEEAYPKTNTLFPPPRAKTWPVEYQERLEWERTCEFCSERRQTRSNSRGGAVACIDCANNH